MVEVDEDGSRIRSSFRALRRLGRAGRPIGLGELSHGFPQVPNLHALATLQAANRLLEDMVHRFPVAPGIVVAGDRAFGPVCAGVAHDVKRMRRVEEARFCGPQIGRVGICEIPRVDTSRLVQAVEAAAGGEKRMAGRLLCFGLEDQQLPCRGV